MTTTTHATLSTEELLRRRGELAYLGQMSALESLPTDEAGAAEIKALDEELKRRGVDLAAG